MCAQILTQRHPGLQVELLGMTTRGDQILDRTLSKVGGKGLFIKELESRAARTTRTARGPLAEGRPDGTCARVRARRGACSARIRATASSPTAMQRSRSCRPGARVGTSSLRRELMLRARYPGLAIEPVRGNVNTRLAKLDRGDFDALVMAAAGLKRLGFAARIRQVIPTAVSLPAPGQGALGIEVLREDDATIALLAPLNDPATRAATTAERGVSRGLGGSCQVPLAAYAEVEGAQLRMRALVGNASTGEFVDSEGTAPIEDAELLAAQIVADLKKRGALRLLGLA